MVAQEVDDLTDTVVGPYNRFVRRLADHYGLVASGRTKVVRIPAVLTPPPMFFLSLLQEIADIEGRPAWDQGGRAR